MNTLNYLYPFGEGHDSYLEYQLCCKRCGKIMHLFLPNELTHTGYCNGGNSCHDFGYSINRGTQTLFADNVIKLRNDSFGNSYLLFDNYHLYPLIPEETVEERKERLIRIKQAELATLLVDNPKKKQWIVETLVNRNDTILNTLEEVIKVYEKTGQEGWDKLDGALLDTTLKDDAISLLQRFGVGCQHTVQHMKQEAVNLLAIDASNNGLF